jgi:DNA-binding transcriptional LysR family regulator
MASARGRAPAAGRLTVRQSFGSTEGVKRAVMAGLGVSIVMKRAVRDETRRGELAWLELDGGRLEKTHRIDPDRCQSTSGRAEASADNSNTRVVPLANSQTLPPMHRKIGAARSSCPRTLSASCVNRRSSECPR